ncbi:transposase [uncultured Ruminococcus sp.]|uniref:transposase n=1 Tax=uncultured Ruminococcus sp. TaxID=165186 RepID=UPI00343B982B
MFIVFLNYYIKKYDKSQKQIIVNRYNAGESVKKLTEGFDVSVNTVYAWSNEAKYAIFGKEVTPILSEGGQIGGVPSI